MARYIINYLALGLCFIKASVLEAQLIKQPIFPQTINPRKVRLVPGKSCTGVFKDITDTLCNDALAAKSALTAVYNALPAGQLKTTVATYYQSKYGAMPGVTAGTVLSTNPTALQAQLKNATARIVDLQNRLAASQKNSSTQTAAQIKNLTGQVATLKAQLAKAQAAPTTGALVTQVNQLSAENVRLSNQLNALDNQLKRAPTGTALLDLKRQLTALKNQYTVATRTIDTVRANLQKYQQASLDATKAGNAANADLAALKTNLARYLTAEKQLNATYGQYKEYTSGSLDFPAETVSAITDQLTKDWSAYQQAIDLLNASLRRVGISELQFTVNSTLAATIKGALASASAFAAEA